MRKQELHPRTEAINKTQKNLSKKSKMDALDWLAAQFPEVFDNTIRIRPLKKGILQDILEHSAQALKAGISKSKLREAVVIFTRRIDYLTCLKSRETRVDLQGNPVNEVTEEEALHAASKIKKRVEKSVKNAKKINTGQASHPNRSSSFANQQEASPRKINSSSDQQFPVYPLRNSREDGASASKAAAVTIKHKTGKAYDPEAVARLKEKLGLSRRPEESKETVL